MTYRSLDNIWNKESKLSTCLKRRAECFGSLETYLRFMRRLVVGSGNFPYGNCLDSGCGDAYLSINLTRLGLIQNLTLLDKFPRNLKINEKYIEQTPELKERIEFVEQDLYEEPIQNTYDLILALTVIRTSELRPSNKKVKNIFNAVDYDGRIIVSVALEADGKEFSDYKKQTVRKCIETLMEKNEIQPIEGILKDQEVWVTGRKII